MIKFKKGYKYQLVEDASFYLPSAFEGVSVDTQYIRISGRVLTVLSGYAWDGPSGPTWDDKAGIYASLPHDAGYQLIREGFLERRFKDVFDQLLYDMCIDVGMWSIRAWAWERGVKKFGSGAVIHNKDILIAP